MSAFWKRRRVRLTAAWTAGAVAVAGGLFWVSGGYDAWRDDRALGSACDGDLAAGPLRALLDGARATASTASGVRGWMCKVNGADTEEDGRNWLTVSVHRADERAFAVDADGRDAPLGHGWTGSFSFSPDRDEDDRGEATAALMLDCGKDPGDGLVATVAARLASADFTRPGARTRLTEVLTRTAVAHAKRTGCDAAKPGGAVGDPGVSVTSWDYKPFAGVTGACAGVLDAATASRWGVTTAVESPTGPKPIESCTLGGLQGTELYTLTAYYGPFAGLRRLDARDATRNPTTRPDGHYFLKAACTGADDTAIYEIRPKADRFASPLALDHAALNATLTKFATTSAKSHGCEPPGLR